jgi:hypothetical protein
MDALVSAWHGSFSSVMAEIKLRYSYFCNLEPQMCVFFMTPNKGSSKCNVSNLGWTLFGFSVEQIQQLSAFNVQRAELHYFAQGSEVITGV